jgi:TolB-like protein
MKSRCLHFCLRQVIQPGIALGMLLLAGGGGFSQNAPLLAVIPLQALGGLSSEQSGTVTRLLETGLVKSAVFQVLEKSQISEVLAAQEYSAEECFDESVAVRLGRLLSARLIVLGTLSRLGERIFLTAKIIEVATGKTLRAEHEEAGSLEAIALRAEALGYRLGGLQPESHGFGFVLPRSPEPRPAAEQPAVPKKQRLLEEKLALDRALAQETQRARSLRAGSRVLYGVSAGLALAAGAALVAGLSQRAEASATPWFGLSLSFAVLGGAGAVVGTALLLEQPSLAELRLQIQRLEEQIFEEEKK